MTRRPYLLLWATSALLVVACGDTSDEPTSVGGDAINWTTGARPESANSADRMAAAPADGVAMAGPSAEAADGAAGSSSTASGGVIAEPVDPPSPTLQPRAGMLTAASFDDHLHPEVFDAFVNAAAQQSQLAGWLDVTQRAPIVVRTADDQPLAHARVRVESAGKLLLESVTGSDGRALYLPEMDGRGDDEYTLIVEAGEARKEQVVTLDAAPWEIVLDATSVAPKALDLAFVVDATGSMGDELEFLKQETASIAERVSSRYPDVDVNYGLIVYRDEGDAYVTRGFGFTDLDTFRDNLLQQAARGGGDYPEAMHTALQEAVDNFQWREGNVVRMAFLLADAPPHDDQIAATLAAVQGLRAKNVRLYPVAASGVAELAEHVMRMSAFITLGRYLWLTDDSGIGNPHAEPKVPCYEVELLQELMIRMISSELAGELIEAEADDILRTVGTCQ
jgi:hypothetical protein